MGSLTLKASGWLERLGAGHCGSVWGNLTSPETDPVPVVIKREDGAPGRSLRNEFLVQSQICSTASLEQVLVPSCLDFMESQDPRWHQILPQLPDGSQGCNAMLAEKIQPVSIRARRTLVENYCPDELRDQILNSKENHHCLVRVYLGRKRRLNPKQRQTRFFSLRNFPLHINHAEEMALPCESYAKAMAEALATLHWKVRTDAADVEFVLASPRGDPEANTSALGEHPLWMLDFDCSRPIKADDSGLTAIAKAFWGNDPYYPRPHSTDGRSQKLWDIFSAEYRRVGLEIVRVYPMGETPEILSELVHAAIGRIEETHSHSQSLPISRDFTQ
ncbi:unnamed protein product [Clonostachys byssicola]|uniref:DUF3669 domain-containing protein n=1 Tax=Clonostachys byssicola TaxID=160290 RepID=A0A9N9UQ74_9HYPO|nr:unnamed protein product [Clonostachys byssicola]